MKKLLIGTFLGIAVIGGLGCFLYQGSRETSVLMDSLHDASKLSSPAGTPVTGASSSSGSARVPDSVSGAAGAVAGAKNASAPLLKTAGEDFKFERGEDLQTFRELKKRVLPSADDLAERERLYRDAALLRSLGSLLQTPVMSDEVLKDQNAALDLLFDALRAKSPEAAMVLTAVIGDPQVENASLASAARENLAGLKAEALYQWSSLDPTAVSQLQAMLPGPVSQKIWANVRERQENNLLESGQEIQKK